VPPPRRLILGPAIAVVAWAAVASPAVSSAAPPAACGAATQSTIDSAYLTTARKVYEGELSGFEVRADVAHVLASRALASAVATDNATAALAATSKLVYHRRWHIVRLRVLSSSGNVLADVGGPDILAPVTGQIAERGKTVGSFVMSVQDDVGYAKLVARFTGLPIEVYRNGQALVGQDFAPADVPARPPANGSSITVGGVASIALAYGVRAFPTGMDRVLLIVPRASATLAASSCAAVNAATYTSIAAHLARQLRLPAAAATFISIDQEFDPSKRVVVRQGSTVIAASPGFSAPRSLPRGGLVNYLGQRWIVTSFVPVRATRAYLLFPDAAPASGATGVSGST